MSFLPERVDSSRFVRSEVEEPTPSSAGVNVLRGQLVRCSSFWENGFEGFHAVDGNLSADNYGKDADWQSQRPGKNQWLKIYLPRTVSISRIRMLNASAQSAYRTREYAISVSTDDVHYDEIARGTLPDDGTTWTELHLAATRVRYLRFTGVTGYNLAYAVGLKEIEAY